MKDHDIYSSEISLRRIHLEVQKLQHAQRIDIRGMGLSVERFEDQYAQHMISVLTAKVASRKYDVKTVKFPKGPWQWIKFNLIGSSLYGFKFVRWFLDKYPVKCVEVTLEANAYHPDIAIPDHATFVEILVKSKDYRF